VRVPVAHPCPRSSPAELADPRSARLLSAYLLVCRTEYGRLVVLARADHLPAVTALSSSSDSRMSCDKSRWLVSLIQRSNAILKTAIPASAARLAAGSVTPCRRNAAASAEASDASLISSLFRLAGRPPRGRQPRLEHADPRATGMAADPPRAHRRPRQGPLLPEPIRMTSRATRSCPRGDR
jgi:hypothetical protein